MSVVRCIRCERHIDLDYNTEVFTNDQIPGLTERDYDWVCFECLAEKEEKRFIWHRCVKCNTELKKLESEADDD